MLDLVPLARARWEMTNSNAQAKLISQPLQLAFPQADPITVTAAAKRFFT